MTVLNEKVPRILEERTELETLSCGFHRVRIRVGFMETPDVPQALKHATREAQLDVDIDQATYYLGRETLLATEHGDMGKNSERLFAFLSRNSYQAPSYFAIPPERVVEIGMQVDL